MFHSPFCYRIPCFNTISSILPFCATYRTIRSLRTLKKFLVHLPIIITSRVPIFSGAFFDDIFWEMNPDSDLDYSEWGRKMWLLERLKVRKMSSTFCLPQISFFSPLKSGIRQRDGLVMVINMWQAGWQYGINLGTAVWECVGKSQISIYSLDISLYYSPKVMFSGRFWELCKNQNSFHNSWKFAKKWMSYRKPHYVALIGSEWNSIIVFNLSRGKKFTKTSD